MERQSNLSVEIEKRYRLDSLNDRQLKELEDMADRELRRKTFGENYSGRCLLPVADYPMEKRNRFILYIKSLGYSCGFLDTDKRLIYINMYAD